MFKITLLIVAASLVACTGHGSDKSLVQTKENIATDISPKLKMPFGTFAKLEVEIYDGELKQRKALAGKHLLKVISINDDTLKDTLIIETEQENQIRDLPFRKRLRVTAYESGCFRGIPTKLQDDTEPIVAGESFHFSNTLVITKIDTIYQP